MSLTGDAELGDDQARDRWGRECETGQGSARTHQPTEGPEPGREGTLNGGTSRGSPTARAGTWRGDDPSQSSLEAVKGPQFFLRRASPIRLRTLRTCTSLLLRCWLMHPSQARTCWAFPSLRYPAIISRHSGYAFLVRELDGSRHQHPVLSRDSNSDGLLPISAGQANRSRRMAGTRVYARSSRSLSS